MRAGIVIVVFFICLSLKGQQHTAYTQYSLNRFALNPALAGVKPCNETTFGTRRQWIGFENAPNVSFASFNTRLHHEDKYPKNFHGVGAHVMVDRYGFSTDAYLKLAYAYHIKLWVNYHLSVGLFAGVQRRGFSYNSVNMPNKAIDPAFNSEVTSDEIYPEISPGGFLYNRNFFVGMSMLQVYPARTGDIGTKDNRLSGHYFLSWGYRFRGRNRLDLIPSFMFAFSPFISPTMDMTLTADYKQIIQLAVGSKYLNSGHVSVQVKLMRSVYLGYAYEYALNELNLVAPSSHEVILNFTSCTSEGKEAPKFYCPAYQ